MSVSLIVPINLRALCVGQNDVGGDSAHFAAIAADFGRMPYAIDHDGQRVARQKGANLSECVLPPPFQEVPCPERGVHLHWALPDALARGVAEDGDKVRLPAAPNRWLVARIASDRADTARLKAWVVESDRLWDPSSDGAGLAANRRSRPYPLMKPPEVGKPFQSLGRVFDYESWAAAPNASYSTPHTMLGYGELSFAAAYPHAPNCFGILDDLDDWDPQLATISYLVIGWYADLADDPLAMTVPAGTAAKDARAALEQKLSWTFADDVSRSVPASTVCSGLLTGIGWDPGASYLQAPPDDPVQIAVGNTTAEAVSAMLASRPEVPERDGLERVLTALQLGLPAHDDEPEAPIRLAQKLHQAGFASTTGGSLWVVRPGAGEKVPAVGAALDDLNAAQGELDALQARIASHRSQIFADWCKFMVRQHGVAAQRGDADAAFSYISSTLLPELKTLTDSRASLDKDLASKRTAAETALAGSDCVLHPVAAPRYWSAHDPVVLLWGDGFGAPYRPLTERCTDDSGNLVCRLSSQLVDALTLPSAAQAVTAAALPTLRQSTMHAGDVSGLVAEAFLLDPEQAVLVAAAAGGTSTGTEVEDAQAQLLGGGDAAKLGFSGLAPAPVALQTWEQPWVPLLLAWEVECYPAATVGEASPNGYSPDFIASRYRLDDDSVDLVDKQGPPAKWPPVEPYQGVALLARNTDVDIGTRIDAYLQDHPDDPRAAALGKIRAMCPLPAMAQALGGFNPALVMRRQTLQLQVRDPLAPLEGHLNDVFSNVTVPQAVADQNSIAALPNVSFNPLRAGYALISKLWIVDIFGQRREVDPTNLIRAEALDPDDHSDLVALPPRIAQPSRLQLRWLSAARPAVETNSDSGTSPICGWMLYNHLEGGLAVYDQAGSMLGSLNVDGPRWLGAPGSTYGESIDQSLAGVNAGLTEFVRTIYDHAAGSAFLTDLLAAIDSALTLIEPNGADQYGGLSALIGRPLAVARASLSYELLGLPALHQGFTPLAQAAKDSQPTAQRWDAGFTAVQVPVRLGDVANVSDGLIGYFAGGCKTTFYAPAFGGGDNGVVAPRPETLKPAIGDAPMILAMLLDPRAAVHATCGLLPVKRISIPPYMFADTMRSLAVTFLTSPVLGAANANLRLPLPAMHGADWSWTARDPGSSAWTEVPIRPVDPSAADLATQRLSEGWLKLSLRKDK